MRVTRAAAVGAVLLVGCGTASTGGSGGPSQTQPPAVEASPTVEASLTGAMSLVEAPATGDAARGLLRISRVPLPHRFAVRKGGGTSGPVHARDVDATASS